MHFPLLHRAFFNRFIVQSLPFRSNDLSSPGSSIVRAPFPPYALPAWAYHASRVRRFRQTDVPQMGTVGSGEFNNRRMLAFQPSFAFHGHISLRLRNGKSFSCSMNPICISSGKSHLFLDNAFEKCGSAGSQMNWLIRKRPCSLEDLSRVCDDIDASDDVLDMELELLTSMDALTMNMMPEDEDRLYITLQFELAKKEKQY
ncbi:hypothetical protein L1987_53527 [Smallanthus sonchifolius]|uniref:Uncharacterized protein n=1 Tax=Smallanthus sonchifolius TaxID=185202 RepID=A0ACB9EXD8_9ASTR|nr:hypothetical protein L1987_53527 [Smallanthus sonchifolius]